MPLLLLDILRGRKVWEEEGEEAERERVEDWLMCTGQVDREMDTEESG